MRVSVISHVETARQANEMLLDVSGRLDESIGWVEKTCPTEEALAYRKAVCAVLGEILMILNGLYSSHPDLKPPGFE
jgi:hypothetical protein